jgi:hypothetical protein
MVGGFSEGVDMAARLSQDNLLYWCEGFLAVDGRVLRVEDRVRAELGLGPATLDSSHHLLACMALRASFVLGNRLEHLEGRTELVSLLALLRRGWGPGGRVTGIGGSSDGGGDDGGGVGHIAAPNLNEVASEVPTAERVGEEKLKGGGCWRLPQSARKRIVMHVKDARRCRQCSETSPLLCGAQSAHPRVSVDRVPRQEHQREQRRHQLKGAALEGASPPPAFVDAFVVQGGDGGVR